MKSSDPFSISQRLKSFKYAFAGLRTLFAEEHNARIHLIAAVVAMALGFVLNISVTEWILLVGTICLVFICELFNTSLETLADFVSPEKHLQIKKVKDLAAAAVFVSAFAALITGIIIFLPKIISLCTNN
ncbi:diacylglycerol kinase [uncultured Fluviicola sp.]|uniref:diacylglycerol kinase n=1 Tax=uncultured Fluviicola sp. TaxID=463303 RepID=UPI0025DDF704|nr:diacylglycerol kinase family protein [uncultured Fluviicola sp.]